MTDKSNLRKRGVYLAHSLRVQSVVVGKVWCQECQAAGHITSAATRKQRRTNAGAGGRGSSLLLI